MKMQFMKQRFSTLRAAFLTGRLLCLSLLPSIGLTAWADDPVLPAGLQDGLALWMEASTNVILNGDGTVGEWRDVREAVGCAAASCLYPRAVHLPNYYDTFVSPAPTLLTGVAAYPGRRFVSMGPNPESGKWMLWVDSTGATNEIMVQSYFAFIKLSSATSSHPVGNILCHTDITPITSANFTEARAVYSYGSPYQSLLTNTETRLDGRLVSSTVRWPADEGGHLFSQIGPKPASTSPSMQFNNFANWRGLFTEDVKRIGGPVIGEILVYTRCVTDAERRQIENYLLTKWTGADIRNDLTAETGDIEKAEGTLRVERNTGRYTGSVALDAGAELAVEQNAELPPLAIKPALAATVGVGSVSMAEGASDTFAASGTGALTVGSVASDVTRITSAGVTLQMRSHGVFVNPSIDSSVVVTNGSFELPALTVTAKTTPPTDWTTSGGVCVIIRDDDTAYHLESLTGPVPEGRQFASLAGSNAYEAKNCEIATTFQIAETGVYGVRLYFAARNYVNSVYPARIQIDVDGTNIVDHTVGHDLRSVGTDLSVTVLETMKAKFLEYEFPTPTLRPGKHTVTIRSLPINGTYSNTCMVNVDHVRIVPRRMGDYVWVRDSSFDSWGAIMENAGLYATDGRYHINSASPANTAWQFKAYDSSVESSQAGMTQDGRFWYWENKTNETTRFADHRKAYLLNASLISNAVTFAQAGTHTFSMRYSKTDWGVKVGDHSATISLRDDAGETVTIGKVWPKSSDTVYYSQEVTIPHAGTYVLTIQNTDLPSDAAGSSKGRGTIIDDVAFQVGSSTAVPTSVYPYTPVREKIATDGSVDFPVAIETAGVWRVNVTLRGQPLSLGTTSGPYHGYKFYPQVLKVFCDGAETGRITVDEPEQVTFALRLPYLAKGAHTVRFQSVAAESAAGAYSVVDGLSFERLTEETMPSLNLKELSFALSDGARLNLDYPGELTVRKLTINGTKAEGTVSAETHPSVITGRGKLRIAPRGFVLICR